MPRKKRNYVRKTATPDLVNSPPHYTTGRFETIDVIEDIIPHYAPVEAALVSNILQYLSRAPLKGTKSLDLAKAQWYMNRLVSKQ